MIVSVHHHKTGDFKVVNTPVRLSRTQCKVEVGAPELGEHTGNVLTEILGLSEQEIAHLQESGIV
jgi:succinate--hydroxymethylglutarate CoA-transferase